MTIHSPEPRLAVPERILPEAMSGFDPAAVIVDLDGETMGTFWRVRATLPAGLDHDALRAAIQHRLDGIVAQMSHWDHTSLLMAFNRAEAGSWIELPSDLTQVIACGLAIAEKSGGAFDPAIGRLTDLWGLGPNRADGEPTARHIADASARSGWQRLAFDAAAARLRQPGELWLDLSGIAKGWAADAVAGLLARHGVFHAYQKWRRVRRARHRPDGEPWWWRPRPRRACRPVAQDRSASAGVATSGDSLSVRNDRSGHRAAGDPCDLRRHRHSPKLHGRRRLGSALLVLPQDRALSWQRANVCAPGWCARRSERLSRPCWRCSDNSRSEPHHRRRTLTVLFLRG